jgi:hypothetical protein
MSLCGLGPLAHDLVDAPGALAQFGIISGGMQGVPETPGDKWFDVPGGQMLAAVGRGATHRRADDDDKRLVLLESQGRNLQDGECSLARHTTFTEGVEQ